MNHSEFKIGEEFRCGTGTWRVTDVGTRVVVAIRVDQVHITQLREGKESHKILTHDQAYDKGWFNGPPYSAEEVVFDEYDFDGCGKVEKEMNE